MNKDNNRPTINGKELTPHDYLQQIMSGFTQMYEFVLRNRTSIIGLNGPLENFSHQKTRFVFRPTSIYGYILQSLQDSRLLKEGIERSIQVDLLSRGLLSSNNADKFWPILNSEKQSIEQMDLPIFYVYSDSHNLDIGNNQKIDHFFKETSYQKVINRIKQLDYNDLEKQLAFIRGSLYSQVIRKQFRNLTEDSTRSNPTNIQQLKSDELIQEAINIASDLKHRAIFGNDDSVTWIALGFNPELERHQYRAIDNSLYDGSGGIAIFLSALAKITRREEYYQFALKTLNLLRKSIKVKDKKHDNGKHLDIGGATGLGSIIYSLVCVSKLIHEPSIIDDAKIVAELITSDQIKTDQNFDIMSGASGAILGLLALYETTQDQKYLTLAKLCGDHLLESRIAVSPLENRTWKTLDGKLLTGFSHGAAGIAYSLSELYRFTHDKMLLDAIAEAIAYEKSVFSPEKGNWPDFRINDAKEVGFMTSWCHGAPGIGLTRLGILSHLDTDDIREDIEIAIQTTMQFGLQNVDHLCCGNMGRVEFLYMAASAMSKPELYDFIYTHTTEVVRRAQSLGYYQLFPNFSKDAYSPGLFQGWSGIGYELLRIAHPNILPSVLLWK